MRIPTDLKIVAYLFLLHGIAALVKIVIAMQRANIRIDFGLLCIFAGLGLLRLSTGWWKFAKIYTLLHVVGLPVAILLLTGNGQLTLSILTVPT